MDAGVWCATQDMVDFWVTFTSGFHEKLCMVYGEGHLLKKPKLAALDQLALASWEGVSMAAAKAGLVLHSGRPGRFWVLTDL